MKIITDSGDEITVNNKIKQQRILGVLFHAPAEPENGTVPAKKKHRKILGSRPWTAEEVQHLMDYPRVSQSTLRDLSIKFHRTPGAIYAKHNSLHKQTLPAS